MLPALAVYAGRCRIDGRVYPAAVNIGATPTFGQTQTQVEAHVIGFEGDLYGRRIELELVDWLRDQYKFANGEALRAQIGRDIVRCLELAPRDPTRPIAHVPQVTLAGHTP